MRPHPHAPGPHCAYDASNTLTATWERNAENAKRPSQAPARKSLSLHNDVRLMTCARSPGGNG